MTQVSTQPLLDITDLEALDLQTISENGQRFYTDTEGTKNIQALQQLLG